MGNSCTLAPNVPYIISFVPHVLPNAGPGLSELPVSGRDYRGIGEALAAGDLSAVILLHGDPMLDADDGELWERALEKAPTVIAHASFLTPGVREHATVVFPAESYAEKEGTVTHPDSRLQRLRRSIARQGETRAEWELLAEIAGRLLEIDERPPMVVGSMVSRRLFEEVPFYNGLTLDEIGGRGVRWTERPEAAAWPAGDSAPFALEPEPPAASPNGLLRLGTFRSIWASPEVQASPALAFLHPTQRVEISPADAERLGIGHGQKVIVGADGRAVTGTAWIREGAPEGTVFLENAIDEDSASMLSLIHI